MTNGMKWKVETTPSGAYKLTSQTGSGYVLATDSSSSSNGVKLVQGDYIQNNSCRDEWYILITTEKFTQITLDNNSDISFFSASNEIPNFNNSEERSLRALYDRFDFKVHTKYVEEKTNRMKVLNQKQENALPPMQAVISLDELYAMQAEVRAVKVPDNINELADNILCELRRKDIPVSDRIYFNFALVVQAEAWLCGRDTVVPADMTALVNYLWDKPEQVETIRETIRRLTENPLGEQIDAVLASAYQAQQAFENAADKNHALLILRNELLPLYEQGVSMKDGLPENDAAAASVDGLISTLEATLSI